MAIEFLDKLDPRRFKGMMTDMHKRRAETPTPETVAGAYRKAMTYWNREGKLVYLQVYKQSSSDEAKQFMYINKKIIKTKVHFEEDYKKLKRMGAYLNATKDLKLRLRSNGALNI